MAVSSRNPLMWSSWIAMTQIGMTLWCVRACIAQRSDKLMPWIHRLVCRNRSLGQRPLCLLGRSGSSSQSEHRRTPSTSPRSSLLRPGHSSREAATGAPCVKHSPPSGREPALRWASASFCGPLTDSAGLRSGSAAQRDRSLFTIARPSTDRCPTNRCVRARCYSRRTRLPTASHCSESARTGSPGARAGNWSADATRQDG
jgi:hypothetical protein